MIAIFILLLLFLLSSTHSTNPYMFKLLSNATFYSNSPSIYTSSLSSSHKIHNILFISINIRGHFIPLQRYATDLYEKGYKIIWASNEENKEWIDTIGDNIKFINLGKYNILHKYENNNIRNILNLIYEIYLPSLYNVYSPLITHIKRDPPELAIIDISTLSGIDVLQKYNIPYIINNPTILYEKLETYNSKVTLYERCINIVISRFLHLSLTSFYLQINYLRNNRGLSSLLTYNDYLNNSLILINTSPFFDLPSTISSNKIYTGPIIPINSSLWDPLPNSIETWLESENMPVIAILGGVGSLTPLTILQAKVIIKGLADSRMRVVWSLPHDVKQHIGLIPFNFRIRPHLSPLSLVSNQYVTATLCTCGMGVVQESLSFGKPVICIPSIGDQYDVAMRVTETGAGVYIDKVNFEVAEVRQKVLMVLNNATFSTNARRIGAVLRSHGGLKFATDIIEDALLNGIGETYSEPPSNYTDVYIVLIVIAILFSIFLHYLMKGIFLIIKYHYSLFANFFQSKISKSSSSKINDEDTKKLQPETSTKDDINFPSRTTDRFSEENCNAVNVSHAVMDSNTENSNDNNTN